MAVLFARLIKTMLLALPVYAAARLIYVKVKKPKTSKLREVLMCLFFIFMAGLVSLVMQPGAMYYSGGRAMQSAAGRIKTGKDINIVPMRTISGFFNGGFNTAFIVNIIANVLMFSPMGFLMPLLWPRWQSAKKMLLAGLCFSVSIETTQLFIGRSTDIDDVILNVLGVMAGYWLYCLAAKLVTAKD